MFAPAGTELIGVLAPLAAGVVDVAVIVCELTVLFVVNTIVATPVASVVVSTATVPLLALRKDPPLVLVNVTVTPDVVTGLLFASASCARMVTGVPTTGVELLDVTKYFVGASAANVTAAVLLIVTPPTEAEIVAVPAVVAEVSVATWRPTAGDVIVPLVPSVVVMSTGPIAAPPAAMSLPFASLS